MFMGHYAPAMFTSNGQEGSGSIKLWQGFLAVQGIDFVFAILAIFGIENSATLNGEPIFNIPWSHSLLTSLLISLTAAFLFKALKASPGWKSFWIIFGLVFSHWILDFLVHRPDLPFYPLGETVHGLSLWNYPWLSYGVEMGMLFSGFIFWMRRTSPNSNFFKLAPWALFFSMGAAQFVFITLPGLQVQAGTFDPSFQLQGRSLGFASLGAFIALAALIGAIESGRRIKPHQSSST